jgi:hypothetical protein
LTQILGQPCEFQVSAAAGAAIAQAALPMRKSMEVHALVIVEQDEQLPSG